MEVAAQTKSREITANQAVFVVWAEPTHGSPRSRTLAKELGIPPPVYFYSTRKAGSLTAPLRYLIQGGRTLRYLFRLRPRVVLVQSPPSFAALFVALYCWLTGSRYLIDAHSDAFQRAIWTRPAWLYTWLQRRAAATLVTDEFFQQQIEERGGKAIVLRDPVTSMAAGSADRPERFTVTVVNTFARDEPLDVVLQSAAALPDVQFNITGKLSRARPGLAQSAPLNVRFTDFLPDEDYFMLLRSSHAVMSLTTRDHTLQCGACEALSLERPIITSNWPLLRQYFSQGTVHVDNSSASIAQAIEQLRCDYQRFEEEIAALHSLRLSEWQQQISSLTDLIRQA